MTIYVEGLCRNNGTKFAKAGYAIVFGLQDPRNVSMRLDGVQSTQRADLSAISHLVTLLLRDSSTSAFTVATHSKWLVSTVNENLDNWKRAGWTNQAREKVENLDLLLQLDKLMAQLGQQGKKIHMEFVRMQEASPAHVLADKLANAGCDMQSPVVASQLSPPQSPQERRRRSSSGFPPQQSPGGHHGNQYGGYPGPGFYGNVSPQQQQYNQQQHYQQQHYQQQQYNGHYQEGYPSPQWQQQQYHQQQYQQEWQ
ncbi:Ribonuclease H [Yarrowia sp. B02]|nr:Ribonuclease H [Yarrowia sp. B02]